MSTLLKVQEIGQSLWLDRIARDSAYDGSLIRQFEDWSITGLSLNCRTVAQAIAAGTRYDFGIRKKLSEGVCGDALACELMIEDVRYAADMLRPVYDRTDGVDGWAVLPMSPLISGEPDQLADTITRVHSKINRPNVLLTFPGLTRLSLLLENLIEAGIPVNITHIYSDDHYRAAVSACLRGVEKRIRQGLKTGVSAFISVSVTRMSYELSKITDADSAARTAVAIAQRVYAAMRVLHTSQSWERAYSAGVRPLRLVWRCSGDEAPLRRDCSVYGSLLAPYTVISMPEQSMECFLKGPSPDTVMPVDGGASNAVLDSLISVGVDINTLADALQESEVAMQKRIWITLLEAVASKSAHLISQENQLNKEGT